MTTTGARPIRAPVLDHHHHEHETRDDEMSRYTHTTVDGARYGIDADGRVMAPDADGRADALLVGTIERLDLMPRAAWRVRFGADGRPTGTTSEYATRADAIRALVAVEAPGSPTVALTIDGQTVNIDAEHMRAILAAATNRLHEQASTFPRDGSHATRDHLYVLAGQASRAHSTIAHAMSRRGL